MRIKLLNEKCRPYRAHPSDSGLDLRANINKVIALNPNRPRRIGAGIAIELEPGYEAQIRPRSGLSNMGVLVPFGTVDNSYRGEIGVVMLNCGTEPVYIYPYDRIAQLVVARLEIPKVVLADALTETDWGAKGFGSTGVA